MSCPILLLVYFIYYYFVGRKKQKGSRKPHSSRRPPNTLGRCTCTHRTKLAAPTSFSGPLQFLRWITAKHWNGRLLRRCTCRNSSPQKGGRSRALATPAHTLDATTNHALGTTGTLGASTLGTLGTKHTALDITHAILESNHTLDGPHASFGMRQHTVADYSTQHATTYGQCCPLALMLDSTDDSAGDNSYNIGSQYLTADLAENGVGTTSQILTSINPDVGHSKTRDPKTEVSLLRITKKFLGSRCMQPWKVKRTCGHQLHTYTRACCVGVNWWIRISSTTHHPTHRRRSVKSQPRVESSRKDCFCFHHLGNHSSDPATCPV